MRTPRAPSVRALQTPANSAVPAVAAARSDGADGGRELLLRPPLRSPRFHRRTIWVLAGALVLFGALASVSAWAHPSDAESQRLTAAARPSVSQTSTPPPPSTAPSPGPAGASPTGVTPECVGEDCVPQPGIPAGSPDPGTAGSTGESGDAGGPVCGITDLSGCLATAVHEVFRSIVTAAVAPIIDLLGAATLTTPTLDQLPGVGDLWNDSWQIVLASYVLFVLAGGLVVMVHETLQTRYGLKEIAPRLVVGMLASALSLFAADKMIRLANALSRAILGDDVTVPSLGEYLHDALNVALDGGLFLLLLAVVLVVVGLGLVLVSVVRVVLIVILLVAAPLCLACHALPATEGIARWWWRAFTFTLAIQIAQALVLVTATRTFLTGGIQSAQSPMVSTTSGAGLLLAALAMFYVLFKIPFWFLRVASGGNRSSLVGSLAKTYVFAKAFGMLSGRSGAGHPVTATAPTRTAHAAWTPTLAPAGAAPARAASRRQRSTQQQAPHGRLLRHRDAERVRLARTPRPASMRPTFLQPTPQEPVRETATGPASGKPPMPQFSSPPHAARPEKPTPTPPAPVRFRAPDPAPEPPRESAPIRTADVPAQLRFRSPRPDPPGSATPIRRHDAPPAARFHPPTSESTSPGSHVRPSSPTAPRFQPPSPHSPRRRPSPGGDEQS